MLYCVRGIDTSKVNIYVLKVSLPRHRLAKRNEDVLTMRL